MKKKFLKYLSKVGWGGGAELIFGENVYISLYYIVASPKIKTRTLLTPSRPSSLPSDSLLTPSSIVFNSEMIVYIFFILHSNQIGVLPIILSIISHKFSRNNWFSKMIFLNSRSHWTLRRVVSPPYSLLIPPYSLLMSSPILLSFFSILLFLFIIPIFCNTFYFLTSLSYLLAPSSYFFIPHYSLSITCDR